MTNENYYVYMLTNHNNDVIYVDMINDRAVQTFAHTSELLDGFTKQYEVNKLVYYEVIEDIRTAMEREREIKKLRRDEKNKLVEIMNPKWNDLMHQLIK